MSKYKFILAGCALLFFACKAVKTVQSPVLPAPKGITADDVIKQLRENEITYQWFSAKAKIEFKDKGNSTSVNAAIRIKNDSAIWMSVTPGLGIEAVRLLITKDSVIIMDKIRNQYLKTDMGFISSKLGLPVDIQILEHLLTGKLIFYDDNTDTLFMDMSNYILSSESQRTGNRVQVSRDMLMDGMEIKDKEIAQRVEIKQGTYIPLNERQFATKREINIHKNDTVHVKIEFSNIKINEPLLFPFNIPAKYEEIK